MRPGAAQDARAPGAYLRALVVAAALAVFSAPAFAQAPVKGEIRVETGGGYTRIVLRMAEEVETDVRQAGNIVVIGFRRPVEINGEKIAAAAPTYIAASRRDPDGLGLRLALNRRVTVNSMAAGERIFIDLLPESWTGLAPGLPKEVIEELARRAREAEKKLRAQQQSTKREVRPARVRVAVQPTFVRYVFELPDVIPISSERGEEDLTLTFSAPLKFDLADAKATLPKSVAAIESGEIGENSAAVRFTFAGKVDIRGFREDNNYVVDVGVPETSELKIPSAAADKPTPPPSGVAAPQTVPARPEAAMPLRPGPAKAGNEKRSELSAEPAPPAPSAMPTTPAPPPAAQAAAVALPPVQAVDQAPEAPAVVLPDDPPVKFEAGAAA
jgi:hypothetical protein